MSVCRDAQKLLVHERDAVLRALTSAGFTLIGEAEEDGWSTITARRLSKRHVTAGFGRRSTGT